MADHQGIFITTFTTLRRVHYETRITCPCRRKRIHYSSIHHTGGEGGGFSSPSFLPRYLISLPLPLCVFFPCILLSTSTGRTSPLPSPHKGAVRITSMLSFSNLDDTEISTPFCDEIVFLFWCMGLKSYTLHPNTPRPHPILHHILRCVVNADHATSTRDAHFRVIRVSCAWYEVPRRGVFEECRKSGA
ncbi:hypothetical protein BDU57DRAFT_323004 [Ampelomyces quisqualis]|uniref:Uncharacterized protein n=1 Tax=Ampelomyces quisqualis TaxID=50730 RepID=A0A6A5QDT2_AMPQU|nr:hypothetical protein BDU57DRAFT_323004 [Ampelomyces quisqualis]